MEEFSLQHPVMRQKDRQQPIQVLEFPGFFKGDTLDFEHNNGALMLPSKYERT